MPSCRAIFVITLVCLFGSATAAYSDNWSQFRGPSGNATSSNSSVPTQWSETENIAWKTRLPGRGASSPVIWEDRVFVTAFTGYGMSDDEPGDKSDLRLHVICIDRHTGQLLWDQSITASAETQNLSRRIADHGYATSTAATDGKAVYAFFGVSGVVAYDFDGKLLWQANVGTKTAGFGSASSPVVFENLLIVNASIESGTVFAFDKQTGRRSGALVTSKKLGHRPALLRLQAANRRW
jgi:outer membrane protein assembly factor BamB